LRKLGCRDRAREAIAVHIDGLRRDGRLIPDERDHCQLLTVSIAG